MDPYEVLQVHPRAETEVIRAAYRVLARKHHPDLGGDAQRMTLLNEAWAILGNGRRRSIHDAAQRSVRQGPADAGSSHREKSAAPAERSAHQATPDRGHSPRRTVPFDNEPQPDGAWEARVPSRTPPPIGRPPGGPRGTVLDFGRYAGWSVAELSRLDPDYLLWLERTSIGRRLHAEIQSLLGDRYDLKVAAATMPAGRARGRGRR
jgi:curved DNA-binding protein CbpA